mgnify:CR=1 FL=1
MTDREYAAYYKLAAELSTQLWQNEHKLREELEKKLEELEHKNAALQMMAAEAWAAAHQYFGIKPSNN